MKALAAILTEIKKPLEIVELDIPPLQRGQVLVKLVYSGLCHTQINEIKGLKGEDRFLPHTLGHEGSGIVLEIGEGVTKVKPQDHVVLSWIKGKGLDVPSTKYRFGMKEINSGAISTFMTHAVIAENRLNVIPHAMPLKEAALFGCALPTGAGVVKNEMTIVPESSFAVFGLGGVGLSAIVAAKYMKADPIIAIDIHDAKLDKALKMGATHTINIATQDVLKEIMGITSGKGVDHVFECAGKKTAMEMAFASLKAPGGLCVIAGNLAYGEKIALDPFDLIRGKRIMGTWGGKSDIDKDTQFYTEAFLQKKISLEGLITHEVPLPEINDLIDKVLRGEVGRGLIAL